MSRVTHYEACPKCREMGKDSKGDNLAIYMDGSSHCFSCGYHPFSGYIPAPRIKEYHGPKNLLPSDFQREVPAIAWKWLLQYGLPYSYWSPFTGYSAKEERLVFKVGEPLQFSIGRYFGSEKKRKWYVWGNPHSHAEIIDTRGNSEVTALVEDLISAHKVGQVTAAMPLFGTEVHPAHLYALRNGSRSPVVLWLDQDQYGGTYKKANRLQSLLSRPVSVVHTERDPKELSYQGIQKVLDKALLM